MKIISASVTRDDFMGMTIAVLMFVLQGCMVLAMSNDHLATTQLTGVHGTVITAHADAAAPGNLT